MPSVIESQRAKIKLTLSLNKLVLLTCLLVVVYFGYERYAVHQVEQVATSNLILSPQVGDIYFLDLRTVNDKPDQKNKYQLAKVVRVSDDGVVIVYGRFFFQWKHSVVNSIKYGELSNIDYFKLIPDYISFSKIKEMQANGTVYLIKRPIQNKLYGNFVSNI